jgi:hypothetical protein
MTPTEYRQFCESTYCAPTHIDREEYLGLLLIEEVGEVASLFAKAMRDGHEVDRLRLKKELGDVLWASSMLTHQSVEASWIGRDGVGTSPTSHYLGWIRPTPCAFANAQRLCWRFGFSPCDVALANVAKLKSRQARGVLRGSGDER